MPNFKKYDYDQTAMVVVNFLEQLQPGTFEFTLHQLIEGHIDLSVFYEKYQRELNKTRAKQDSHLNNLNKKTFEL
jgi:hypothetical protein